MNNAGIFFAKPFTEFTAEDFEALSTVHLEGFLYVTQGAVRRMLAQNRGGSVIGITSSTIVNPIAGGLGSVPMLTKGGIEAITRSLAIEYAKQHIRFNAVAPGIVDTPMHANEAQVSPIGFSLTVARIERRSPSAPGATSTAGRDEFR